LFPLVFGGILTYQAYYHVSIAVAVFVLIAVFFACRIKSPSTNKGQKTHLREFWREIKKPENKPIRVFNWAYFFCGIAVNGGAMGAILTIISYRVFDTNLVLGIATSAFTVCTIISGLVLSRYVREHNRNKFLLTAFFAQAVAVLVMAFYTTTATIIVFSVVNAFCLGVITTLPSAQFFDFMSHKNIKEKYRIEYIIVVEMFLAMGRILGFVVMVLAGVFFSYLLLQIVLVGMLVSLFVFVLLSCIVARLTREPKKQFRYESNPELALEIMQKASARLEAMGKLGNFPRAWRPENTTMEKILNDYEATPEEFIVVYVDDEAVASGILQRGDRLKWAKWPTEKEALYGYRFAGNPDSGIEKTRLVFDALKEYGKSIGVPVIRIDCADFERAKLRLYMSQGFEQVGSQKEGDENWVLLEYDPLTRA